MSQPAWREEGRLAIARYMSGFYDRFHNLPPVRTIAGAFGSSRNGWFYQYFESYEEACRFRGLEIPTKRIGRTANATLARTSRNQRYLANVERMKNPPDGREPPQISTVPFECVKHPSPITLHYDKNFLIACMVHGYKSCVSCNGRMEINPNTKLIRCLRCSIRYMADRSPGLDNWYYDPDYPGGLVS